MRNIKNYYKLQRKKLEFIIISNWIYRIGIILKCVLVIHMPDGCEPKILIKLYAAACPS